jgi:hypothetical protein
VRPRRLDAEATAEAPLALSSGLARLLEAGAVTVVLDVRAAPGVERWAAGVADRFQHILAGPTDGGARRAGPSAAGGWRKPLPGALPSDVSWSRRKKNGEGRSEFHYGSFSRRVTLPKGAREDQLTATYRDGILEIRVPIEAATAESRSIPIARGASD